GELLAHGGTDAHPRAEPEPVARAAGVRHRRLDRVRRLELRVLVEVPDDGHLRALVERRLDLGRERDVLQDEARDGHAVLGQVLRELAGQARGDLALVRGEVDRGDLRLGERRTELADDEPAEVVTDLVRAELRVRTHELAQERRRVDDLERVGAERADADGSELGVAQDHGVLRAPREVGELARRDEVHLRLERRAESVLPALDRRQDRQVLRLERVRARAEHVGEAALADEHRRLALAHDELRLVLDLVPLTREAPDDRVPALVEELDDVDQLAAQLLHEAHPDSFARRAGGTRAGVRTGGARPGAPSIAAPRPADEVPKRWSRGQVAAWSRTTTRAAPRTRPGRAP